MQGSQHRGQSVSGGKGSTLKPRAISRDEEYQGCSEQEIHDATVTGLGPEISDKSNVLGEHCGPIPLMIETRHPALSRLLETLVLQSDPDLCKFMIMSHDLFSS